MMYRQSLMKYAEKYGVSKASRKYNKSRSYICFWKRRYDGTVRSLACQSRRPHSHPKQHTAEELKLIRDMRRRNPKLGMAELRHRLRKHGYTIQCVQTDSGPEFTNRFSGSKRNLPTLFESTAAKMHPP